MGLQKIIQWTIWGVCISCVGLYLSYGGLSDGLGLLKLALGLLIIVCALLCFYIAINNPADSHSIRTIFASMIYTLLLPKVLGRRSKAKFLAQTEKCKETQENLLLKIVQENSRTLYGKDNQLDQVQCLEDLKNKQPLTDYKTYDAYVERIMEGEANVMTKERISFLAMTSGTTGKNKVFPIPANYKLSIMSAAGIMFSSFGKECNHYWNRQVMLRWKNTIRYSKCGIPMSSISQHLYDTPSHTTTPRSCYALGVEKTCLYIHALFALKEPDVGTIDGFMSPLAHSFFKLIMDDVDQLCKDIDQGKIDDNLDIPADIRNTINLAIAPDKLRAAFVREEVAKGPARLGKRLWPKLGFVAMASTGSFSHYAKILEASFLRDVNYGSFCIMSSEGLEGYLLDLRNPDRYTLAIDSNVFEFICENDVTKEKPETLFAHQLNIGELYEIVMTTARGLYRYRLGDVVEIVDYRNQTPVFVFKYRTGQLLNVCFEKMPEHTFYKAMELAEKSFDGATLVDYTAVESSVMLDMQATQTESKHYYVFVEMVKEGKLYKLSADDQSVFDKCLCIVHEVYKSLREKGIITPTHIIQVQDGTFAKLTALMKRDYVNQQFKMPRALRNKTFLKFLLENEAENI